MKGDFSRRTFDATKHYSAVLVEQGRLLTDADSEEEHRILSYREERATQDIIGNCGAPLLDAGFGLSTPDNLELRIGAGSFYAAGTLLENESEISFRAQPDRFDVPWPLPQGRHAVVLDSWRRLITALDDRAIREVALGGPTTSSRERVVWQVGAVPVPADWTCTDALPDAGTTTGELAARSEPDEELSSPCLIPPQAGYTGLENQFYRVEIFDAGNAYDVDAAADTFAITGFPAGQPNQLTVAAVGDLAAGHAVEVVRTGPNSDPLQATFGYVADVDAATLTLTLSTALPAFEPTDAPLLRRVDAAFVVSRDNGAVVTAIEGIDGAEVTVHDTGPDDVLGFAIGQLVEVSDDRIELGQLPRRLHQIADIDQSRRVIVLRTPTEALEASPSGIEPARHPKLRRWDAAGAIRFRPDGKGWIHLESGNQVRFVDGRYRSGDYWTFPARAATVDAASGTIEWPQDGGAPALLPPFGIDRHRCVLGYVDIDAGGGIANLEDCRTLFPPLTSMRNLLYAGGDGQEGSPADAVGGFIPLPGRLDVRVANGGFPVAGATVRFAVSLGAGRLEGGGSNVHLVTDANGRASCRWEIDAVEPHQTCVAQLMVPSGDLIPHQAVTFHATIDADENSGRGCCLSIGPGGDYGTLDEALKDLIGRDERDICLCLMPGDHTFSGGDIEFPPEKLPLTLSIRGCGRAARLHIEKRWRLEGLVAMRLCDFDLMLGKDVSIELNNIPDVAVIGCQVYGLRPDGAMISVRASARLHVVGSVLIARRPDTFQGTSNFFRGLDTLAAIWEAADETEVRKSILDAATSLSSLSAAARRKLVREIRTKVEAAGADSNTSRGELNAYERLAAGLEGNALQARIAELLELVSRTAAFARAGVPLEIGASQGDDQTQFANRASVVLSDNIIPGTVTFYGRGEPHFVVPEATIKQLSEFVHGKGPILGTAGDVHIRDNRLGRLGLGIGMIRALDSLIQNPQPLVAAHESFHITDNVFDAAVSEIVARHTAMSSNDFTLDALPPGRLPDNGAVVNVIADTATYTGNHMRVVAAAPAVIHDIARAHAEAANLELQILSL